MCIILGEAPDPEKPMENTALFISVDRSKFSPPKRQIPVGIQLALVYGNMEGTVHWLYVIFIVVHIHGRVHVLVIETKMSAGFPKVGLAYMR